MVTTFVLIWAVTGGSFGHAATTTSGVAYFSTEAACAAAKAVLSDELGGSGSYVCIPDEQQVGE